MTPYERFFAMLDGKKVDRAPNLNIFMMFASDYIGKNFSQYCQNYEVMVEGNLKCNEAFGVDLLNTMSDAYRETYDYGASLIFPENDLPHCKELLLKELEDVNSLKIFDPFSSTRILDRIKAIELYKKEAGNHYPILGWVEGAFAENCDLRGMNNAMVDIMDEDCDELYAKLMDLCTEQGIICAKAQMQAGADIIGIGDAAASVVGPNLYAEKILPYEKRLIDAIHKEGGRVKLHICGDTNGLLEHMKILNADIIDIDSMVDMEKAVSILAGHSVINGNIDPVATMLYGDTKAVEAAVKKAVDESKGKACISAGCEIPKFTPNENLLQFSKTLKEYYK